MRKPSRTQLIRKELRTLKRLLAKTPAIPHIPEELFIPIMRKNVPVTIDLAIARGKKILLTYRRDAYFTGWHFPGSFMAPGETAAEAVKRTARVEAGLNIRNAKLLGVTNCVHGRRFHFVSFFFLSTAADRPTDGKWFSKQPSDLIPGHKHLWRIATTWLRGKSRGLPPKIKEA